LAPQVDANANQFQFGGNLPQANAPFNFGNWDHFPGAAANAM
jgi:hypothetical protein